MRINDMIFNCDLSDVIAELQLQLVANGIPLLQQTKETETHIQVQCPYHKNGQERKPSAGIRKSDGKFHCFTCGEVHSLQEVISYCFGRTDDILGVFGWKWLLRNFATVQVEERKEIELDFSRNDSRRNEPTPFVSEEELDKYRYIHPYMFKRKLTYEVIDQFDVGYDEETNSITFPVRDIEGNCLFIARRNIATKFFNYPKGVTKPLYGLYELHRAHEQEKLYIYDIELIVCESMIDALTCWVYGKPAVALNGLGNDLQFKQLRELPCRKLILATDADEAGMKARERIRKNVTNKIITEYIWDRNEAKDINDMSRSMFLSLEEIF